MSKKGQRTATAQPYPALQYSSSSLKPSPVLPSGRSSGPLQSRGEQFAGKGLSDQPQESLLRGIMKPSCCRRRHCISPTLLLLVRKLGLLRSSQISGLAGHQEAKSWPCFRCGCAENLPTFREVGNPSPILNVFLHKGVV